VVAYDLITGVALRPEYGSMFGSEVESETELAGKMLKRLPKRSVVVGDRNFGTYFFTYEALLVSLI